MSGPAGGYSTSHDSDGTTSRFTYQDLHRLSIYSPQSPLRVIALVDYDAFYAQCESVRLKLATSQPLAVQQWHAIIALNYAARGFGFSRGASIDDVKRLCPNIILQHVPTWREGESSWAYRPDAANPDRMKRDKAALDPYRIESRKSLKVIKETLPSAPLQLIEKASVDEVFLDLSAHVHSILLQRYPQLSERNDTDTLLPLPPRDFAPEWKTDHLIEDPESADTDEHMDWDEVALNIGAEIIRNLRSVILARLHYTTSAGIAHNKALAKLGAGFKKPYQQTVIRQRAVTFFLSTFKVTSIRGLAGKLGARVEEAFSTNSIPELLLIPQDDIIAALGVQDGMWLFNIIRGVEHSKVVPRTEPQSMLTQKTFVPPLSDLSQAASWMQIFVADLVGRINDLNVETGCFRRPTTLVVHHHIRGRFGPTVSKQGTIPAHSEINEDMIYNLAMKLLKDILEEMTPAWPCLSIGLAVHGLVKEIVGNQRITSFMSTTLRKRKRDDEDGNRGSEESPINSPNPARCAKSPRPPDFKTDQDDGVAEGYLCPTCTEMILPIDVLEHLDWHVAFDLQEKD